MITIFNRRELILTFSLAVKARVQEILEANGINYRLSVGSNTTFRGDARHTYETYFYVHKRDYENALFLISKVNQSED